MKPKKNRKQNRSHRMGRRARTADGQLGASCDKLEVTPACRCVVVRHNLDEVPDRSALDIEAVVGLQRLAQGYERCFRSNQKG